MDRDAISPKTQHKKICLKSSSRKFVAGPCTVCSAAQKDTVDDVDVDVDGDEARKLNLEKHRCIVVVTLLLPLLMVFYFQC